MKILSLEDKADILNNLGFNKDNTVYITDSLYKEVATEKQKRFIEKDIIPKKISIDRIYFIKDFPAVYFKSIDEFSDKNLADICLLHKSCWNQRQVPFLYVSTPFEIRVYNLFKQPINPADSLEKIDDIEIFIYSINDTKKHLENLLEIFNKVGIDSGRFWKDQDITKHIAPNNRVDKILVQNLKDTKEKLKNNNIEESVIHDLLIRSLFTLYLEDIGATKANFYKKYDQGALSYFDLLSDENRTGIYNFFQDLEKTFNGNLFPVTKKEKETVRAEHLKIIRACFWGDNVRTGQGELWKKFDFSIIPIELLSQIYEMFLKDITGEENGEYYTPHGLVDFILNKTFPWADIDNRDWNLKILDPAAGSGIFLVESYRRLIDRWTYSHNTKIEFEDLKKILLNSIFGFEINKDAVSVAAFSLYLALLSYLEPKTLWEKVKFPYLIFDPDNKDKDKQGKNLFRLSSLSNSIIYQPKFDLIIGNPPFKSSKSGSLSEEAKRYCKEFHFAQELVLPFLHRASQLCGEKGNVAIISTSKILFNKSKGYLKFREFLFKDNYVDTIINFSTLRKASKNIGKSLFANAVGPACVLFFRKLEPEDKKDTITYICPKPTAKDKFIDRVIISRQDCYYLPRAECIKEDAVIWKTAMWGTERDFILIQRLRKRLQLNQILVKDKGWECTTGFQFLTKEKKRKNKKEANLSKMKVIPSNKISRYYTPARYLTQINDTLTKKNIAFYLKEYKCQKKEELPPIDRFYLLGKEITYEKPHLLVKEGQSKKEFTASYIDFDCCFKDTVSGISFQKKGISEIEFKERDRMLKCLTAFLNSKFSSYFLFLTSISWGIDRERVTKQDMLELPAIPFEMTEDRLNRLAKHTDDIIRLLKESDKIEQQKECINTGERNIKENQNKIAEIESQIDQIIYDHLELTDEERFLIDNVLNYSIDLFQEGEDSDAYKQVELEQLESYTNTVCSQLYETLQFGELHAVGNILEMPKNSPLQLISVYLSDIPFSIKIHKSDKEVDKIIEQIDKYTYQKHSESIYYRKIIKYYEGDYIYIVKPNERRFWSNSMAMEDAEEIIIDILNMKE